MKNDITQDQPPFAYFLTFRTYGTWLHGDTRSSIDREHNAFGTPRVKPDTLRHHQMTKNLKHNKLLLNNAQRKIVLKTFIEVCQYSKWHLYSAHVRSNHAHIIVSSDQKPEYVMGKLKAYSSRELNTQFPGLKGRKYWTPHGSTRYIFSDIFLYPLMRYVILQQGDNAVCYYDKCFDDFDITDFRWD